MEGLNSAFEKLAKWMHLPVFFRSVTLIFNNLFLLLVGIVLLICLILVIRFMPGKKKKAKKGKKASTAESEVSSEEETVAPETTASEEQKTVDESVVETDSAEEPAPTVTAPLPQEEAVEAPAEKEIAAESESDEKEESRAAKSSGKYEIVKRNDSFFFLLKANNGQLLLESSAYTTEQGVRKAIDTFKKAVEVGEFTVDEDKNGNFKFILRASARSQMLYYGEAYSSRQSAENAIGSVKNFAFTAAVKRATSQDVETDASSIATTVETKPLKESDHKLGGKYEIVERSGSFYFLLKANNGQLLLESPAFTTEAGAKSGIDTFKKAADSGVYVIDKDKNGNFRFILRASTRSQVRYFGESYGTRQSAENSVSSVRAFAQKAILK